LGGRTPQDAAVDHVHARYVGDGLDRERAQRLEPRHCRPVRRGREGHRHDRARAVGLRRDLQRLRERADGRKAVTDAGRVIPRRDPHTLIDDLHDQALAVGPAPHADRPGGLSRRRRASRRS
jgi:hypothetical protein